MKPQLVIFDWAGTTVDYGCFAPVNAFALAFQKFGVTPTVEEIRAPMGMLKRDHIRTMLAMPAIRQQWEEKQGAFDEAAVEKIYGVFEDALMESLSQYAAPKPGVLETVAELRARGMKVGSTTGYTDKMMAVVTAEAARQGYAPDAWFSPDSVQGLGRPYPYMIYANMAKFQIASVEQVVKVGDTVADIQEGKHAGVLSLGVLEGSSVMGYTQAEYEALPQAERQAEKDRAREIFLAAGADGVLALGGRLLYLTHGHVFHKDHLPPLQAGDILLHGHTHIPGWETLEEGRQCWNPGSVALPKAGSPHSYMILEGAWVQWKDLSGGTYHTLTVG